DTLDAVADDAEAGDGLAFVEIDAPAFQGAAHRLHQPRVAHLADVGQPPRLRYRDAERRLQAVEPFGIDAFDACTEAFRPGADARVVGVIEDQQAGALPLGIDAGGRVDLGEQLRVIPLAPACQGVHRIGIAPGIQRREDAAARP